MILRSLTKHVKDQNWFAVWIDFAIVVVGVFIGLQVANWNEVQAERAQTQRMLSELIADLAEMGEVVAVQSGLYLDKAALVDALLNSLEAGDKTKPDEIAATIERVLTVEVPPSPPAGLNELLISGRLDLLSNTRARDALRQLAVYSNGTARASGSLLELYWSAEKPLRPYLSVNRNPNFDYRTEAQSIIIAVDIEGLWSDARARVALTELYDFHASMRAISQFTEDTIAEVFDAVPELSQ